MLLDIEISKIFPHPDNPRKDLGDLTELTASIEESGILQNLTVVPWSFAVAEKEQENDENESRYIAIIGHRRLAAARLAGLQTVPCAVVEMDQKTQLTTMITENMQRSDLTISEQAFGFQLMLDLGETVSYISKKTGLSATTIRRRTKLLELEKDGFKAAVERGVTLTDFAELDKINDPDLRNKVLETIGTSNFSYELQRAVDKEKMNANKAEILALLDTFAAETRDSSNYSYIKWIGFNYSSDFQKPEDADERKYFYKITPNYAELYAEKEQETAENPADTERQKTDALRAELGEISDRARRLRTEFVKEISALTAKNHTRDIMEFSICGMIEGGYKSFDEEMLSEMLGVELGEDEELSFSDISEKFGYAPERIWLIALYCNGADVESWKYYDWQGRYTKNAGLDALYSFLSKLGYQISDEESAIQNGSHELYKHDGK